MSLKCKRREIKPAALPGISGNTARGSATLKYTFLALDALAMIERMNADSSRRRDTVRSLRCRD
ncbi:MAG: hypothetical protein ABSG49_05030 [Methanoregula sp.]|jgi:hypothetical protein|uniref:hypothetical protein n=1 Tax=Methanoregula sp. TaxID=2052170 RepID=UPI003C229123